MSTPKIFRITIEVANLDQAAAFYAELLATPGQRHPGSRHYFDCGGVILSLLDPTVGGMKPIIGAKAEAPLYFAVDELEGPFERARALGALAPYKVHGEPAGEIKTRPWGERSFYVTDPSGNELCFVQDGTLYT